MRLTGFYHFQIWVSGFLWDMWTTSSMEVKTSLDVPRFFTQVSNPGRVSIYLLHKLKFTKLHPDQPRVGHGVFLMMPSMFYSVSQFISYLWSPLILESCLKYWKLTSCLCVIPVYVTLCHDLTSIRPGTPIPSQDVFCGKAHRGCTLSKMELWHKQDVGSELHD